MRYWKPQLRLGIFCPPEAGFADRFGGLPWGLPANRWPLCPDCHRPYGLLLQMDHHPERLNLGRSGRRLFAFQCVSWPNDCSSVLDNGTALILEPEQLLDALTSPPPRLDQWWASIRVMGWAAKDDRISPEICDEVFYDDARWLHADDGKFAIDSGEKVGGAPWWPQGPQYSPGADWRMLVQFTDQIRVRGPVPTANQIGCRIMRGQGNDASTEEPTEKLREAPGWIWIISEDGENSEYIVGNFNFGLGSAYVLGRKRQPEPPDVCFHWQR